MGFVIPALLLFPCHATIGHGSNKTRHLLALQRFITSASPMGVHLSLLCTETPLENSASPSKCSTSKLHFILASKADC
eukprot:5447922-Amphidinium_carterae.1